MKPRKKSKRITNTDRLKWMAKVGATLRKKGRYYECSRVDDEGFNLVGRQCTIEAAIDDCKTIDRSFAWWIK